LFIASGMTAGISMVGGSLCGAAAGGVGVFWLPEVGGPVESGSLAWTVEF
jgi:hypothetical protein